METLLSTFLLLFFIILILISIITVWLNLPGTFLFLFIILLISTFNNFETISIRILIVCFLVFIILEIIEFLLSLLSVKLYGGKISSSFLSVIGGVIGAFVMNFLFPIIGTFIGFVMGSYLVTYFNEKKFGKTKKEAIKIANSTTIGYMISKGFKTSVILFFGIFIFNLIK